jgi:hypothetical protein
MASIAGQTRRRRSWYIASGWQQSDAGGGIGSDQTLKIGGNETSNIEGGVNGECRVLNGADEAAGEMAEWIEGVGRGQRGRARGPSERIGEKTSHDVKVTTDLGGRHRAFEPLVIG